MCRCMLKATFVVVTWRTFKKQLFRHYLRFHSVQVYHGHLRTGLPQGVSERSAYTLTSTRHIGHLSVKAHPIEDGAPLDPAENLVIQYFTLRNGNEMSSEND